MTTKRGTMGMMRCMSMVRKTITLPEELVTEVEALADGNVSAFVAETWREPTHPRLVRALRLASL